MKIKFVVIFILFASLLSSGFGCKAVDKQVEAALKPITINYWRVWDGPDAFQEIINNYKVVHPNINIIYRKLRYEEYENELLNAMAEDKGPDIFSLNNTWMRKYQNKIINVPAQITMAYPVVQGTIKKEIVPQLRTSNSINMKQLRDTYLDVVFQDVVWDEKIWGLPLSVDTLAMFYNRDLFNNAGVAEAPVFWNYDFQQDVKRLTKYNVRGEITQAGVAMGTADNINRYTDLVSVLMMQNGADMLSDNGRVLFQSIPARFSTMQFNPGMEALRFYTDFANSSKEVYSWNNTLPNSLDMFTQGNLAIMFGYSYDVADIKSRSPKLNFSVAKLPQIEDSKNIINYANYWVETVSRKSKYAKESWDFIQFAAKAENVKSYLARSHRPTALVGLVDEQKKSDDLEVFADQLLTAKSWYRGNDFNMTEKVFQSMINEVVKGDAKIEDSVNRSASRVQQTIGE